MANLTRRAAAPDSLSRIPRSLLGMDPGAAALLLAAQERAFSEQLAEVQRQTDREQAEQGALEQEAERLRQRIRTLQGLLAELSGRQLRERERLLLAGRVVEEEIARFEADHNARLQDLRFEEVRVTGELRRLEEEFRALVAQLFHAVDPAPLDPHRVLLQPLPTATEPSPPPAPPARSEWQHFLTNRPAAQTLTDSSGEVIIKAGERVSPATIALAEARGVLTELLLVVQIP